MPKTMHYFLSFLSLFFYQHSFAVNMQKNYKIPQETVDSLFRPAEEKSNIFALTSKESRKASYLNSDTIFVKIGLKNMGRYRWNPRYNAYVNTKTKKSLFLKKNRKYLISTLNSIEESNIEESLKSINRNNLSKESLKEIFRAYTDTQIKYNRKIYYNTLVKHLEGDKLLHLKDREYLLIVDKALQNSYIFQFHKKDSYLEFIGGDRVSTGNPNLNTRNSRFIDTPIAIIDRNRYKKGDWRADKTNFSEYGKSGNRVFYLGRYIVPIEHNSKFKRLIHLAIHATNPIDKELLGHKASKGCIRISDNFNKILSKTALIDGKNGRYVIIIDSKLSIDENIKRAREISRYKKEINSNSKYAMR